MRHIPVDRSAGAASYAAAVAALKNGEIVGVFPEATISESYAPKEFKTGAARMAAEAGVPLIPMVTFGGQRIFTKGRPRDLTRGRRVVLRVGEPLKVGPDDDPAEVTGALHEAIDALVSDAVAAYPREPGADEWWIPASLR
jgi:1-acyl-sn-glycerol-3-phosphate acyltransferase